MKVRLNRIILYSQDVEGLKNFYTGLFELPLVEEIKDEWVVLNAGAVEIAFHRVGAEYRTEGRFLAESNAKIVFEIESDIFETRARLIEAGAVMREVKSYEGFDYLLCDGEDMEGNVFQLMKKNNS
jgi:predicted enzyme related to lactoylglutathione lyase